jgi:hypothetical protein
MSNGTSSCPTVTLPFGLFSETPTIAPLDAADIPPADPPPGLEQFILDNAPTDATPLDGFDAVFTETVGIIDALDAALGGLAGELLSAFAEADLVDAAPVADTVAGFTSSLGPVSTGVDDLGTLLRSATPPSPGGGAGGGGSAKCGTHGQSSVGRFDYKAFDVLYTLPVLSVADGTCVFRNLVSPAGGPLTGETRAATAFTLLTGDTSLWKLGVLQTKNPQGEDVWYETFTMTPTKPGHYDATAVATLTAPPAKQKWAVSVDVIA